MSTDLIFKFHSLSWV